MANRSILGVGGDIAGVQPRGGPEHDSPGALMRDLAIRWSGPDELLSPYREMQAGGE